MASYHDALAVAEVYLVVRMRLDGPHSYSNLSYRSREVRMRTSKESALSIHVE